MSQPMTYRGTTVDAYKSELTWATVKRFVLGAPVLTDFRGGTDVAYYPELQVVFDTTDGGTPDGYDKGFWMTLSARSSRGNRHMTFNNDMQALDAIARGHVADFSVVTEEDGRVDAAEVEAAAKHLADRLEA